MEFCSQEYWSGVPFPPLGDLPDPGIEPRSPAFQADSLTSEPPVSERPPPLLLSKPDVSILFSCLRQQICMCLHTMIWGFSKHSPASPVAQMVKNQCAMQETWVRSLGLKDLLEKVIATRSSILAWRIPWTNVPGWAVVHRATKNWTWLSNYNTLTSLWQRWTLLCPSEPV